MRTIQIVFAFGLGVLWFPCFLCVAGEPNADIESVLAKWEEASQKCRSLDAKLTVFHYDVFGGGRPTITQGRFYYEAPHVGYYEMGESVKGAVNRWSYPPETIVWNGKETMWIEESTRTCKRFSADKLQALLSQAEGTSERGRLSFFAGFLGQLAHRLQGPEQFLPLVVGIRAAEVRERFDVTIERRGGEIVLKAVPKQPPDSTQFRGIDVILNAKTYMTHATQTISLNGRDRTVCVLDDQTVNQRPSDRDRLIDPDLSAYRVTEEL